MGEKKIVDLEKLTPKELLDELVERLCAYRKSMEALLEYTTAHSGTDTGEVDMGDTFVDLVMDKDEDYCRVREVVRFVKGDDTLWTD